MTFENSLSEGKVIKQLVRFSIPFLAASLIQNLYSIADMVIVGQFSGSASMAGINVSGQIALLVTNLVIGFGAGATVLIGQYLGADKRQYLKAAISSLFTALFALSVLVTLLLIGLCSPLLRLVQTPAPAFAEAQRYLTICGAGTVFVFGFNAISSTLRGFGDSKRPLLFVTVAGVTNILLDLLFVAVFHWGAGGAAVATVLSQGLSMALGVLYLRKHHFLFDFRAKSFRLDGLQCKRLAQIGLPTAMQNVITDLSFLFLIAIVNTLGMTASAAVGAVSKLTAFAIMPGVAMMSSISAMTAHNMGAGKPQRATRTMWWGMAIACSICTLLFLAAQFFPTQLLSIFTKDVAVLRAGTEYLRTFSFYFLLEPVFFCMNGLFIGAGHTVFALFVTIAAALLARIPVAFLCGVVLGWNLSGMGLAAPVASCLSIACSIWFFRSGKWKQTSILKKSDNAR